VRGTVEPGVDVTDVDAWLDTCEKAEWYWPPVDDERHPDYEQPIDATAYVQEVDFHWFHGFDTRRPDIVSTESLDGQDPPVGYQPQADILEEIAAFQALVLDPAAANGYTIRWIVGELGFPAEAPGARRHLAARSPLGAPRGAGVGRRRSRATWVRLS